MEGSPRHQERPSGARPLPASRRERARTIAMLVLGGAGALFAFLNFDEVEVNWLLGTWSTPLIVVIAVALLFGMAIDRILVRRSRKRAD